MRCIQFRIYSDERIIDRYNIDNSTNNYIFSNINEWEILITPVPQSTFELSEKDIRRYIKMWAKDHIHKNKPSLNITDGIGHYIKDCKNVYIHGTAIVDYICGKTTINMIGGNACVKYINLERLPI